MQEQSSDFRKGIAKGMKIEGASRREITLTNLSRTIQWKLEMSTKLGKQSPQRKAGSGRPKSLDAKDSKKILTAISKNRSFSLRSIQKDEKLNSKNVSLQSISNFVKENGYSSARKGKNSFYQNIIFMKDQIFALK